MCRKPRFLHVRLPALCAALSLASLFPRLCYPNTEMANQMTLNACFDHSEAARDFGSSPRPFAPGALAVSASGSRSS